MAFAGHKPGSQHLVLHAVSEANPQRDSVAEWAESQLSKRCTELCGTPCSRQVVGMTLRLTLEPKGLVASRKVAHRLLLWSPTEAVRELALLGLRTLTDATAAQGRRLAAELAPLAGTDRAAAARALRGLKAAPRATPPQPADSELCCTPSEPAPPCACDRCGRQLQLRCSDLQCIIAGSAIAEGAAGQTPPLPPEGVRLRPVEE